MDVQRGMDVWGINIDLKGKEERGIYVVSKRNCWRT
jgi:hypothetical protein